MTREETKKIIMGISCSYPNFKPQCDLGFMVDIWTDDLADYTYEQVYMALKKFKATDTSGFAPSIGQLIESIRTIQTPNEMSEMQAWDLVRKALSNSTYRSKEEFEKLPEVVQMAVGSPNQLYAWATDDDYNESVISSNFMRSYKVMLERSRQDAKMPQVIKDLIEAKGGNLIESSN